QCVPSLNATRAADSIFASEPGFLACEKSNRRFAISQRIQLNPFASCKIAPFFVFWICSAFVHFAPVSVTIWGHLRLRSFSPLECHRLNLNLPHNRQTRQHSSDGISIPKFIYLLDFSKPPT